MSLPSILYIALLILAGLGFAYAVKVFKLPSITGYLIAGLLIGPYVLNIVPLEMIEHMGILSEAALGFIAFNIGGEFRISYLKKMGKASFIIAFFAAFIASAFVFVSLYMCGASFEEALLLGAIASATAPAATVMVVNQYRAKGPVTETLLSVVAIDDAVALMLFGLASGIVNNGQEGGSIMLTLLTPVLEIVYSLVVGGLLAILFRLALNVVKGNANRLILSIAFILLGVGVSQMFGLSDLLLCMSMGGVLINIAPCTPELMRNLDEFTPIIFLLFFVLSGAELDLSILPQIGLIGVVYISFRVLGKILGAALGGKLAKAPETVQKYIGFTLLPQAGVALGLSILASQSVPEYASTIRGVVLCATMVYELFGPAITKKGLQMAGEISKDL